MVDNLAEVTSSSKSFQVRGVNELTTDVSLARGTARRLLPAGWGGWLVARQISDIVAVRVHAER